MPQMMNFFNRVIVSILLIALIVLLVPIAVTPQGVAEFVSSQLDQVKVEPISLPHLVIALAAFFLIALALVLLRLEWRRPVAKSVQIVSGGQSTELSTASVAERLRSDVLAVAQVQRAVPTVTARGRLVDIEVDVLVDPDVDVPAKSQEIEQVVRESVARMGLKLGRPRVKITCARDIPTGSSPAPSPE